MAKDRHKGIMMKVRILIIAGLALLLLAYSLPTTGQEAVATETVDLFFSGADFNPGIQEGVSNSTEGLTLTPQEISGQYISPIIEAPIPFNAVVPQWIADIPDSAGLTIQLRTGTEDGTWSEWFTSNENHDWTLPDDPDIVGEMITVPAVDKTHQKIQYAVSFSRSSAGSAAVLQELRLTLIDSSQGPSAAELVSSQEEIEKAAPESAEGGYPKPLVVGRDQWCTHAECNYSDGLKYESVTHLILHHTVSSSDSNDWAALVRAIWSFHTYTRGWGDIGYNYLVDPNGVIYEGHLGGDDVIGTHAASANEGSMGVAMIGDYRTVTPPAAMRESVVNLFSWKADQKNIDVYDSSSMPETNWGLPNLMGHRDVYGTTQCPGSKAHSLLPWLRDEVARRINFVSPYIYVDELSSAFNRSDTGSWNSSADLSIPGCGFNIHTYYTWSTTDPSASTEWAEWRPVVGATGLYEVQTLAPFCKTGRSETEGAHYSVTHANGTNEVVINQEENLGNWSSLGRFTLKAGNNTVVKLTDLTTTDDGAGVWFDAIRLKPVESCPFPVITNQEPAHDSWVDQRKVRFKWALSGAFCVGTTTLEVATDYKFTDPVISVSLNGAPKSHEITFTKDYPNLFWRVIVKTTENQVSKSMPSHFGIDTENPTSRVSAVYRLIKDDYYIILNGSDGGSGVVSYNIDFRKDGDSQWTRWLTETSKITITVPWKVDESIWFRSQAKDALGHIEPLHNGDGDINTDQAIQLQRVIMLPQIWRD
jgi:hypothetical protein